MLTFNLLCRSYKCCNDIQYYTAASKRKKRLSVCIDLMEIINKKLRYGINKGS
jgi:hypothetical protein